jgi:hypothetical protein
MTDAQIDALIEKVKPEIRVAIRAVMEGQAVHIFDLLDGTNSSSGIKTKFVMFIAHEAPAAILEATVRGFEECGQIYQRLIKQGEAFIHA